LDLVWSFYECMNMIDEEKEKKIRYWWFTIKYNGHAIKLKNLGIKKLTDETKLNNGEKVKWP